MLDFFFRRRARADAAAAPEQPAELLRRGQEFAAQGLTQEALDAFDRGLALAPKDPDLHLNRGNALHALGRPQEALAAYDRVLELAPDYAGAAYNQGLVLRSLGSHDDAVAALDVALAIRPDFPDALNTRAVALTEKGKYADALSAFERLASLAPAYPDVLGNIAYTAAQIGDWSARERVLPSIEAAVERRSPVVAPFVLLGITAEAGAQLANARSFVNARHPAQAAVWEGERYGHDRIRVAYLSADFRDHAVSYLMAGVLERHDRDRFEIAGISWGAPDAGPMRARLVCAFDHFVDVRLRSDAEVARSLREAEVDIAVDLMGHTGGSRPGIFAQRPAPVQVGYLGYPGTTGASYVDYILADRFVIPEAQRRHYSESVVYLPDSFQANDDRRPAAASAPTRGEARIPPDAFVYCSFNNGYKINRAMFDVWMRILRAVDNGVLWLHASNEALADNLRGAARDRNVDPARLILADKVGYAEHLARLSLADVFLDTLPFNGGTTASDALWSGVPVLTCAGNAFAARMAGSLLTACGLPELVTHTLTDYEDLAIALGRDAASVAAKRQRLGSARTAPLFDTDRFRRHLEAAYATMIERAQRGESPCDFAVDPIQANP
jgi:protein O-GlcNAc transferase